MPFSLWWLMRCLRDLGWPRKRGLLRRRRVVGTVVLDSAVGRLAHIGCGLGASRPDLAARAIAQSFNNRDWEAEGVGDLLNMFDRTTPVRNVESAGDLEARRAVKPAAARTAWDDEAPLAHVHWIRIEMAGKLRAEAAKHAAPDPGGWRPPEAVVESPWNHWAAQGVPQAVELAERLGQRDPLRGVVDLKLLDDYRYRVYLDALWASALYFGMTHVAEVERFTEAEQRDFSATAPGWIEAGLNIPPEHPWDDVDAFYQDCAAFIAAYQAEVQPLPPIPRQLREALVAAGADLADAIR